MQILCSILLLIAGITLILSDNRQYRRWGKRTMDLVLGTILFVLCIPVMIVTSVVVFFDAGWPIIFTQKRVGLGLKEITIYKFHTLKGLNGESFQKFRTYEECEKRASKVGKFLRHHCLDEFPQFLNVIQGDLSLVGNRPTMWDYFHCFDFDFKILHELHSIPPGLTGYVQIACFKNTCDDPERVVKFGRAYVQDCSFFVDLKVLYKTVSVVFRGR